MFSATPTVDAVKQVAEEVDGKYKADIDLIKVVKKRKKLEETELAKGMVMTKKLPAHKCPN
jgi:chaperonin GroEL (HSP60 family)